MAAGRLGLPAATAARYHPPVDDAMLRVILLVRVLVPFVFFMASVYLALHMLVARLLGGDRPSATLWFFSTVTGPLTRPVRALLPAGASEARVRVVALAVYVGLWIVTRLALRSATPTG